ncbi:MAG: DUF4263 domain-containing protein [Oligoflexia bacterium]|nr:DUF4263 domain-containing protein [Oligoflexia bacterium]
MVNFEKENNRLILVYTPESIEARLYIIEKIKKNETYIKNRVFHFNKQNLTKESKKFVDKINLETLKKNIEDNINDLGFESLLFDFGTLQENSEHYKINNKILDIKNNLYIHKTIKLEQKLFVAYYRMSIFKYIDDLIDEDIYLGIQNTEQSIYLKRSNINAISYKDFMNILKEFPSSTECAKYRSARLSSILSQYFESRNNAIEKYEKYMNRKKSIQGKNLLDIFREQEKDKYKDILEKLNSMLKNEELYNEKQWQKEIIDIIRLIFPKYVAVFDKVKIKDENRNKELDYLLIDSEGYIDIIEIKRPLGCQVLSKNRYRDNYYPIRELSGTVMQAEKYILYLNKWGQNGEMKLNERYKKKLPGNLKIKITNPGAMIILGRSHNLTIKQKGDFEVIKRKYKNIIDIITYDDLIRRLETIISQYN